MQSAGSERDHAVGQHVQYEFAGRLFDATVIEDRGPLGRDGEHVFVVEFWVDEDTLLGAEVPATRLAALAG